MHIDIYIYTRLPTPPQPDGAGQRGAACEADENNSPSTHELPFSDMKIPASAAAPPTIPIIALIISSLALNPSAENTTARDASELGSFARAMTSCRILDICFSFHG